MVLDKFKNFLKKDEDKGKGRKRTVKTIGDEGGPDRDLRRKKPDRRDRSGRRSRDLGMPSEKDLENLPDIPSAARERKSRDSGPRSRNPRNDLNRGPSRREPPRRDTRSKRDVDGRSGRGGALPSRPESEGRSRNSGDLLQRVLDRLDDIDRRLERVERRL